MKKPKIDAKQAVEDIRAGMDDCDLMAKYHVSAKGLESLFGKLVKAGALDSSELERRHRAFSGTVVISRDLEIVAEEAPQPPPSVQPEPAQLPKAEKTRTPISARALAADVRSGIDDSALMAKYDLSSQGLDRLLRKLVGMGAIQQAELDARMPSYDQTVDLGDVFLDLQFMGTHEGRQSTEPVDIEIAAVPPEPQSAEEERIRGVEPPAALEPSRYTELPQPEETAPESIGGGAPAAEAAVAGTEEQPAEETEARFMVKTLWYEEPAVVFLLMFTIFPLGFYLLYRHPELATKTKAKALGIWCLVLITALVLKPGDSRVAGDLVEEFNKSGNHCHGEISGIFDLTLRLDWTSRTQPQHVKNILIKVMTDRKKLISDGVRYLEYPNNAGTYNVIDFKTGKRSATDEKALPWFKAENSPPGK